MTIGFNQSQVTFAVGSVSAPTFRLPSAGLLAGVLRAMEGGRHNLVRRRGRTFLDALAAPLDCSTLWSASMSASLLLHIAFIVAGITFYVPEDGGNIAAQPRKIILELVTPPNEVTAVLGYSQSDNNIAAKELDASSPEPPRITSSRAKYLSEAVRGDAGTITSSEDVETESRKMKYSANAVAFEALKIPADNALDSETQAQNSEFKEQRILRAWEKQLIAHLARHRSYPTGAANPHAQVTLTFVLDRGGHIVSAAVLKSSSEAGIDRAALTMMARSDPVPPPPSSVADRGLTFTLPIVFTARRPRR